MDKAIIKEAVLNQVNEQVRSIQESRAELNISLSNETKSTSGDKHETGRAMVHLEMEKLDVQLANWQKMQAMSTQIDVKEMSSVLLGSLVTTNKGCYFISVGLGRLKGIEEQEIFCLAANAPLAQLMLNKKAGDKITFNNQEFEILFVD